MVDRVRPLKMEAPATGGTELDLFPTATDPNEDYVETRGVVLQDDSSDDDTVIVTRDASGNLTFQDGFNGTPVSLSTVLGGGGLTPATHNALDQLVHAITESCYYEVTYTGFRVTAETWWTDATKTTKVREIIYTYTGFRVTQEVQRQYDGGGSVVETLTISYTYLGSRVQSATQVRT